MKSPVIKRSIVLNGHKTSISLEDAFWRELRDIAWSDDLTIGEVVGDIDTHRQGNLSSAIRLFVLDNVRTQVPGFLANVATKGNGRQPKRP